MNSRIGIACALGVAVLAARPAPAHACGGCFAPPRPSEQEQVVTDHRMAMAIHPAGSILWDQIRYSGAPDEFSWVLPVSGDVQIELASDDFFERLESLTAVTVYGPQPTQCPGTTFPFAGATNATTADGGIDGGVQVLHQEVVGPYDTVTLRSTDPNALTNWLDSNGYVIPASIQPVIASYVALHMDFVALKLQPGEGVQAMQPVRIRYASAITVLPLRMVAAGVADKVGITLYVFADGRWEAANFGNATVDPNALVWNWDTNSSNYADVFRQTLQNTNGGRAWITEFVGEAARFESSFGVFQDFDGGTGSTPTPSADWALATNNDERGISVTRMRTSLAPSFLDTDLQLQASTAGPMVSNVLYATHSAGDPPSGICAAGTMVNIGGGNAVSCRVPPGEPGRHRSHTNEIAFGLFGVAGSAWFWRRRRSRSAPRPTSRS